MWYNRRKYDIEKSCSFRINTKNIKLGIMNILKENKLLQEQKIAMLLKNFGKNNDLFKRLFEKKTRINEYSKSIKKFAVSLYFLSPKAYHFIREKLNGSLLHQKIISK